MIIRRYIINIKRKKKSITYYFIVTKQYDIIIDIILL